MRSDRIYSPERQFTQKKAKKAAHIYYSGKITLT